MTRRDTTNSAAAHTRPLSLPRPKTIFEHHTMWLAHAACAEAVLAMINQPRFNEYDGLEKLLEYHLAARDAIARSMALLEPTDSDDRYKKAEILVRDGFTGDFEPLAIAKIVLDSIPPELETARSALKAHSEARGHA